MLFTRYDRGLRKKQKLISGKWTGLGDPWSMEFELWRWGAER